MPENKQATQKKEKKTLAEEFGITDPIKRVQVDAVEGELKKQVKEQTTGRLQQGQSPEDILKHTPPCIVTFINNGMPEGGRNNSLFHVAVYFQKMDEFFGTEDWKDKLAEFNTDYCDPMVSFSELTQVIKNATPPGKYQYLCKQSPMCNVCDKEACLKRRFGVGEDKSYYGDMEIMSMIKIDSRPPVWIPRVNGVDVEMDTETLLSPRLFRMALADSLNILMPSMKQSNHDDIIGPIMKDALTVEPMSELTVEGKVMNSFNEWTKNMVTKSKSMRDLEKGLPYYEPKDDIIFFRGADFIKEYKRVYKDNTTERGIWSAMRRNGFQRKQVRLDKSPEWIWYFPMHGDDHWFDLEIGEKF